MKNKMIIQGGVLVIQTAIFPYYLMFLKNIGENYSTFSLLYATFAFSSGISYLCLTLLPAKPSLRVLCFTAFSGLSLCMLGIPFASTLLHVFLIQGFMGIFQAVYKWSEKEWVKQEKIEWRSDHLFSFLLQMVIVATILATGWLLDWFSIGMLFAIAAIWYMVNGVISWRTL
ncbi:hypothetical protein RCG23_24605 [Neobacillus sp. PS3-34]|uniref:hypothetical protein n=1 Tax=Neobacillus sp. PS3-34 TaxID=3070678 RepID=UPI0027E04A68|nr:hypothetical protein [Neobacillus sp. PS3-34]WML48382.1 hypothetical protein RCG23_24605 [Neobacillus sp. PS3-34]